jgi:SAM-dependent methyltransferase
MPDSDVPDARGLAVPLVRIQDGLLRVVTSSSEFDAATLAWLDAVVSRHTRAYSRPEFLKAVRALSSRYVEARASLTTRSPLDSAGKRAAFAGFYAPLHFLVTRAVVSALDIQWRPDRILDLGCGTGVAGLAWARSQGPSASLTGLDLNAWVLDELVWNARTLGVQARTRRTSLVTGLHELVTAPASKARLSSTGIVCGWSLNELERTDRERAIADVLKAHTRGAAVLILEPLALSAVPWWRTLRTAAEAAGGRDDEWRFVPALPPVLTELDEAAGFRRAHLTARSVWLPAAPARER